MNSNIEVDNEEDQRIQYVNRPAISIPSGGAIAFNLNIVNPGINNQTSYILNSVNPVSQNIVAYQAPMTLQSYITLPGENGDNIVNNLPVGVVPMGLPVPAELLQNPALVNTSIIIGNDDCNAPVIFKSANNDTPEHGDYKISYIQKPVMSDYNNGGAVDSQNLRSNNSSISSSEGMLKKPCPLEMSIKAANIDLEFEKCDNDVTLAVGNGVVQSTNIPIIPIIKQGASPMPQVNQLGNIILSDSSVNENILKSQENQSHPDKEDTDDLKKPKTEITWENKDIKIDANSSNFQESLICEVEEANDDEDNSDEESAVDDDNDNDGDYSDNFSIKKDGSSSSEESDVPLSEVKKLDKLPDINKNEKEVKNVGEDLEIVKKPSKRQRSQRAKKQVDRSEFSLDWIDSDEDVLDLKRIKNEFNYNCYYEPKAMKSTGNLVMKPESNPKKFIKVRNCCAKKECYKKITLKDQKTAHKNFYDLESKAKQNAYLINCLEHVQSNRAVLCEDTKENNPVSGESSVSKPEEKKVENTNIQLDIENESNGNQLLSDEIQNAINESLKDCFENQQNEEEKDKDVDVDADNEVKIDIPNINIEAKKDNHWNYYIVIDRCRKKVCLQFLIKLFRISKTRIKILQKKILSGTPLTDDISTPNLNEKNLKIWETAKLHLQSLKHEECEDCKANPRHSYFFSDITRQELFDEFKEYYLENVGTDFNLKYSSYKRFLVKETNFSFLPRKSGICPECESLLERHKKEQKKLEKAAAVQSRIKKLDRCVQFKKRGRKKKTLSTDSEEYSTDDEPLSKRKKLKLKISLKPPSKIKNSTKKERKNAKKEGEKRGRKKLNKEEKGKSSGSKGRDVWSLMLLHLESMPYKVCKSCVSRKKHKFFDSSMTTQALYEDYRKYFLKETNSELGLGFTMYEKYFEKNCGYTIKDVDVESPECPRCALEPPKPDNKSKKNIKNNNKVNKKLENFGSNCRS